MRNRNRLFRFIDRNLFITVPEAKKLAIDPMTLTRLVESGELYRPERGIYTRSLEWLTDPLRKYLPACTLYPDAVICGISALTYYDLTDEEERYVWISVPVTKVVKNSRYRVTRSQGYSYSLGVKTVRFGKRAVRIYDAEKSVVDAFKHQTEEVAYKALKGYLKRKKKDIHKLCEVAKKLRKPLDKEVRILLAEE